MKIIAILFKLFQIEVTHSLHCVVTRAVIPIPLDMDARD